ncbi:hypothetical protein ACN2WE_40225 [Streptomyces sp. cg28]|uniref:hypothetical protein n=1 Tax=Streptomyces sp. cg28 TaxID=3403457 RepID=UPI003B216E1A
MQSWENSSCPAPYLHFLVQPHGMDHCSTHANQAVLSRESEWFAGSPATDANSGVHRHGPLRRTPPDGSSRPVP